ncbi:MAG: hypothetical protein II968_03010 [Selenomonadaceae bacterium]|nr:hypothetical protein [Selenomonadaceae bacterium]
MRTIKFRGRRLDAPLVYGDLIHYLNGAVAIQIAEGGKYRVDPDSVGQFTEFLDKDGAEVYEGDALELDFVGAAKVIGDGSLIRDLEIVKPTADAKLKVEFSHGRYQLKWRTKNGCVDTGIDLYLLESVKQFVRRCD